jgi:hypothetical protein
MAFTDAQREYWRKYDQKFISTFTELIENQEGLSSREIGDLGYVFVDNDRSSQFMTYSGLAHEENHPCEDWLSHLTVRYSTVDEDDNYTSDGDILSIRHLAIQDPELLAQLAVSTILNHVKRGMRPVRRVWTPTGYIN